MDNEAHPTRQALLDAGLELLHEMTPATLVAALRTREIARRAGVSAPAFFHHFASVDDYARALVDHVFQPGRIALAGVVTKDLRDVQRIALPAEQSVAYHTHDLRRLAADREHRVRMGLWALGGPDVDDAFRRFVAAADALLMPQAQALHDVWGREVRPPLDLRSYLALQVAILSGAVTRHLIDPEVMTPERYARVAAALSMVMLRPRGDRRTMDDRLSEMNYAPGPRATPHTATTRRDATRARIIDAAAELFGEYGFAATSITRVARTAGVHVATLYDHFESKVHLGLTLFDLDAAATLASVRPPEGTDPVAALRRHLEAVSDLVATHQDLAPLYLTAVGSGDRPAGFADVLRAPTLRLVAAAMGEGGGLPPERATDHVLVAVVGATLRHPGDGPAAAADAALLVVGIAGSGLAGRPR